MDGRRLKELGLKATRPRLRVLEALQSSSKRHLSADDIHRRVICAGVDVGVASIYRILAQLESVGVLNKHIFEAGIAVFEVNCGDRHDHLVCTSCGRIEDFKDRAMSLRRQKIADEHGYDMAGEPMTLRGRCGTCTKRRRRAAATGLEGPAI